ncbi:MAG TPA: DNA polymerase domain-containing protein [Anaerolineaceae bacterium]|nr:DNA polymerase domain-containing protein [Anaerolineaceae bacterium]HPN52287.1 DNA polymerase domain-containing protein [Anaerolineaceae bacterium]
MTLLTGWILDLYETPGQGVSLWLLAEDGRRLCLQQDFPCVFYAWGPPHRLRALWRWLQQQPDPPRLERVQRRDLFQPEPLDVMAIETAEPARLPELFRLAEQNFPDLTWYDADIQLSLRHAARHGTFPLACCRVEVEENRLRRIEVLDSRWDLDTDPPPLRILSLRPDCDPAHQAPSCLLVEVGRCQQELAIQHPLALLNNLRYLLQKHDPDLLLTAWGDTWLLPWLLEQAETWGRSLPFNRDERRGIGWRRERSYFSYGQIVYQGQQVLFYGRWHIDQKNAMLWSDSGLEGTLESARVTGLPVQMTARCSPGTGISAMQMIEALRSGVLVPWHKQQSEAPKNALDLLHADQGGLVYQPKIGLHRLVGAVDFVSMYPSVMVKANISPEVPPPDGLTPASEAPGLVPRTLQPLLAKRVALKQRRAALPAWDPRRRTDQVRSAALKWLLVVCFGYLGYKNARFGRIEAHEAVTSGGREACLRAKEAAEDLGFEVLHIYVDGLWVQQAGFSSPADFQPLLQEIERRTGLPVGLDGVYRWVAFLPSRLDARVPVANRYFGVFQNGEIKVRGIEARRRDTPPWVAGAQMAVLTHLAQAEDARDLPALIPGALELARQALLSLRRGEVPAADLLTTQRLSREVKAYAAPSPAARAALQLLALGRELRPGQRVRFLWMRGWPGVHAWDQPTPPNLAALDLPRYETLLLRAMESVLQPLGVQSEGLRIWLREGQRVSQPALPQLAHLALPEGEKLALTPVCLQRQHA